MDASTQETQGQVTIRRSGSGEPLVLIHGLGGRWQHFEPVIDDLARDFDVIAVDLPGFGETPLLQGVRPGPKGYSAWLAGWLAEEGIQRPHIVGNSMGGAIALELARTTELSSVTVFSPAGFYRMPGLMWSGGVLMTMRLAYRLGGPITRAALGTATGRRAMLGAVVAHPTQMTSADARDTVKALASGKAFAPARNSHLTYRISAAENGAVSAHAPTTITWGTGDRLLIYRTQSRRARAAYPAARHVDLEGCGHVPFGDDPTACARVIRETAAEASSLAAPE
ncbi:alpha/beta fold hydrolase [Catenulispora rubra]|uniref:alpha/beta fold hydrolase n=1 Tax=Catenulispora rubra TaxID=280293 RepID=UPI0018923EDE|nr:alpha/beta hydrolase [Catenulispora rubra]